MDRRLATLSFDDWIAYVFDNPPDYRWFDLLDDWGELPPAVLVTYLTRLFEDARDLLDPFSNEQLNQSFWFLVGSGSDAIHALFDEQVPWPDRRRCVRAIYTLFADCFAPRCGPFLSHRDESRDNALNSICYMWWDLFPTWGQPEEPRLAELDAELLAVMEQILALESDACRESALHGLGHWMRRYPRRVETIIDAFLAAQPALRAELKQYALNARCGCIQ